MTSINNYSTDIISAFRTVFFCLAMLFTGQVLAATIYVNHAAAGAYNGTSWTDAYTDLQDALAAASGGDEIWVAQGTYYPTSGTNRSIYFSMKNGVGIYGGFNGTESQLSQRNWDANLTTLSGDIGSLGNNFDNSYHVIFNDGINSTATIDGFTIEKGYADAGFTESDGGGMYNINSFPSVTNCKFNGNVADIYGGGMYNESSSPTLTNCKFNGNTVYYSGGGIYNVNSSPVMTNCEFNDNWAGSTGGGVFNDYSFPALTNCSFANNTANNYGGGMVNIFSSPALTGCTFNDNSVDVAGGGIYNSTNSSPSLTSCIFNGNMALSGGGIYNTSSSPSINRCSFINNVASFSGGGIFNYQSDYTLTNCIFSGNTSVSSGGGMRNSSASPTLENCSFSNNSADSGNGGMYSYNSFPVVTNCIFWNNGIEISNSNSYTTVSYSIVQGGFVGAGNLNQDPLFADADGNDLHLLPCSPAIDAAWNLGAPSNDYDGNPRPFNATGVANSDRGAFEYQTAYDICMTCSSGGNVIYVNKNATGNNNGKNWTDAYTNLQDALANICLSITEVWVAAGTYYPTSGNDRSISFVMKNNLTIYGGFDGTETQLSQRDWQTNITILSGDIGMQGDNSDNSFHVISNDNNGLNSTAVLDGFNVMGGTANGGYPFDRGGGMYNGGTFSTHTSPSVANCTFSGNSASSSGGGIYNRYSSPEVTNCTFSDNSAGYGGGIYNVNSSLSVTNCTFDANSAGGAGGGLNNNDSSPSLSNCTFKDNSASIGGGVYSVRSSSALTNCIFKNNSVNNQGGGMYIVDFSATPPSITNCTFSGNSATNNGGGVYITGSITVYMANCIFWGNSSEIEDYASSPAVSYSIVQGGYGGTGNLDTDPLFVNATGGDLHLQPCSPAIDAGNDNTPGLNGISTDLDGNTRFFDAIPSITANVDMGAYEHQSVIPSSNAACKDVIVELDADSFITVQANVINNNSSGCGVLSFLINDAASLDFDCDDLGDNPVTLTVTDGSGNSSTCTANVTVEDNINPMAVCEDITVQLDANGNAAIIASDVDGGSMDNCGIPSLSVSTGSFTCADLGINSVSLSATDGSGNSSTCMANVSVEDNISPQLATSCPDNITLCGAQNVSWTPPTATDNCAVVTYTSNYDTGDYFDVGTYVVSYTFYDAAGLSVNCNFTLSILPSPEVEIIQNNLPAWCQGVKTLSAKLDNSTEIQESLTYMWSNDLGSSAQVTVLANGSYSVTVTDDNGCSTEVTTEVNADLSTLLSAHTILSGEDMEMAESVVLSGGAGVQNAGEVTIQNNTDITTFLRAANAYIDGSSTVTNYINADSPLILPPFLSNPYYNNNDIYVPSGGSMTLSGSNYGNVKVGKNATLIINNGNMYLKSLSISTASTIIFNQPTNMMIKSKLKIGLLGNINVGGPATVIYVSDNASVGQGSMVEVDIFAQEGLEVNDSGSSLITNMTGMFIGIDGVFSNDNVIWNWNTNCGEMPANGANTSFVPPFSEGVKANLPHINKVLKVYPNPTSGLLNIDVSDYLEQSVELILYNVFGKTVWHKRINVLEKTLLNVNLTDLADGLYYLNLKTAGQQVSKQIVLHK